LLDWDIVRKDLAKAYPKCSFKVEIEDIIRAIGLEVFGYKAIRAKNNDFAKPYGIPEIQSQTELSSTPNSVQSNTNQSQSNSRSSISNQSPTINDNSIQETSVSNSSSKNTTPKPVASFAISNPKQVTLTLKKFNPTGANRQKVITLKDELINIKLIKNPLAFCFLLRSIFEISAKIYCKEKSISTTKSGGRDKSLVEILRGATNHITQNKSNKEMVKVLHGAMAEMAKPDGMLSVTSMNQLVHNQKFSIIPNDIAVLFGNIYPLLEAMN